MPCCTFGSPLPFWFTVPEGTMSIPRPPVLVIELLVIVLYCVGDKTSLGGFEPNGEIWIPGWLPSTVFAGPTVMCVAPAAMRMPNVPLPTMVPFNVRPTRLRVMVESCVPLSTRMPPHPELTMTLALTVSFDSSGGHGEVPQLGLPSRRTPTWLLTVSGDALLPVGSVPMKLPITWLLIVPVPWEISTPELMFPEI